MGDQPSRRDGFRYVDSGAADAPADTHPSATQHAASRPGELRYVDHGGPDQRGTKLSTLLDRRRSDRGTPTVERRATGQPTAPGGTDAAARRLERHSVVTDLLSRAAVAALFTLLSVNLLADFMRNGHVTALLLLASESLVVVLTVVRRRARLVDRSALTAVMTLLSVVGPAMLRTSTGSPIARDAITAMMLAVGLAIVVAGKVTLGRSFGIAPANRGVVMRGPYTLVRHPIYSGYLITHVAFFMANPTAWNGGVLLTADVALILRALMEERVLRKDAEYEGYCQRVNWHLVPGVF